MYIKEEMYRGKLTQIFYPGEGRKQEDYIEIEDIEPEPEKIK